MPPRHRGSCCVGSELRNYSKMVALLCKTRHGSGYRHDEPNPQHPPPGAGWRIVQHADHASSPACWTMGHYPRPPLWTFWKESLRHVSSAYLLRGSSSFIALVLNQVSIIGFYSIFILYFLCLTFIDVFIYLLISIFEIFYCCNFSPCKSHSLSRSLLSIPVFPFFVCAVLNLFCCMNVW